VVEFGFEFRFALGFGLELGLEFECDGGGAFTFERGEGR
jgi:hypothetical protein